MRLMRGAASLVAVLLALAALAAFAPWLMPDQDGTATRIAAAAIFVASYAALAIGKVPGLSIDRAGVALVGACLMVASGAMPLADAYRAVDFDTITLLLGMMIVVANLRLSGFFALANAWVAQRARRPLVLLAAIVAVSGLFSAFLLNDAICLVLAPLVVELTVGLRRNPLPYLLAVAMASNVGSTATITANPQNIMIGSFFHIPYAAFAASLTPIAFAGLVLTMLLLALLHRDEFRGSARLEPRQPRVPANRVLVLQTLGATAVLVALFLAGQPPAKVAIIIGALPLLTRRVKKRARLRRDRLVAVADVHRLVHHCRRCRTRAADTVDGAGRRPPPFRIHSDAEPAHRDPVQPGEQRAYRAHAEPFVATLPDIATAWKVVAMASTLAGNFSVLGSIANLIVVEKAAR